MKLVIEDDAGTRSIVPFASDELVIGRGTDGVAWRLSDRNVSRRHARFSRANGAWWIEDLESLTGTRVNGERIQGKRRLREGDLVEIGDYDLAVLSDPAVAAGPATPPPIRSTPRPGGAIAAPVTSARAGGAARAPAAAPAPAGGERGSPVRAERSRAEHARAQGPGERGAPRGRSEAIRAAPVPHPAGGSRLTFAAVAAAVSALLGLAAGYLAGWLGVM